MPLGLDLEVRRIAESLDLVKPRSFPFRAPPSKAMASRISAGQACFMKTFIHNKGHSPGSVKLDATARCFLKMPDEAGEIF